MSQIEEPFIAASLGVASYPAAPEDRELRDPRVNRVRYLLSYLARRPGLTIAILWIVLVVLAAFLPGLIAPDNPLAVTIDIKTAPSWHHIFGTDEIGRDLFSRVVYGSQLSMRASLIANLEAGKYQLAWGNLSNANAAVLATEFSPAGSDYYKLNDSTLNGYFAQEYASADVSAQNAWAAKAQQRIIQQVYAAPVFQLTSVIATSTSVHGVQFGADSRLAQLTGAWISK